MIKKIKKRFEQFTVTERTRNLINDLVFLVNCIIFMGWSANPDSFSFFSLLPILMFLALYVSNEPGRYGKVFFLLLIVGVVLNILKYQGSSLFFPANGRYIVLNEEICIRGDKESSSSWGTKNVAYFEKFINGRCDKRFEKSSNKEKYLVAPKGTKLKITKTIFATSYGLGGTSGYLAFVPTPVGTLKLKQYYGEDHISHVRWEDGGVVQERDFYRLALNLFSALYLMLPVLLFFAGIPGLCVVLIAPFIITRFIDKKDLFSFYAKITIITAIFYPFAWSFWGHYLSLK